MNGKQFDDSIQILKLLLALRITGNYDHIMHVIAKKREFHKLNISMAVTVAMVIVIY